MHHRPPSQARQRSVQLREHQLRTGRPANFPTESSERAERGAMCQPSTAEPDSINETVHSGSLIHKVHCNLEHESSIHRSVAVHPHTVGNSVFCPLEQYMAGVFRLLTGRTQEPTTGHAINAYRANRSNAFAPSAWAGHRAGPHIQVSDDPATDTLISRWTMKDLLEVPTRSTKATCPTQ